MIIPCQHLKIGGVKACFMSVGSPRVRTWTQTVTQCHIVHLRRLQSEVSSSAWGDPAPGCWKVLRVEYKRLEGQEPTPGEVGALAMYTTSTRGRAYDTSLFNRRQSPAASHYLQI
eukprot:4221705-Amphidinium_carterae.1